MTLDDILEKVGYKFEDLNSLERETVISWSNALSSKDISVSDIRDFIDRLKVAVENELAVDGLSKTRDLYLKARLKNLLALEGFISGPEKAKKALELYLGKKKA